MWPGAKVGFTKLVWMDVNNPIATPGGIFLSTASIIVVSTNPAERSFVNRQPVTIWPFSINRRRAPCRGTTFSSGPLNKIKSRKKGRLSTAGSARFRLLRDWEDGGLRAGKYRFAAKAFSRMIARRSSPECGGICCRACGYDSLINCCTCLVEAVFPVNIFLTSVLTELVGWGAITPESSATLSSNSLIIPVLLTCDIMYSLPSSDFNLLENSSHV